MLNQCELTYFIFKLQYVETQLIVYFEITVHFTFWTCNANNILLMWHLPISQSCPVYPGTHSHVYELPSLEHVPPFIHGPELHATKQQ